MARTLVIRDNEAGYAFSWKTDRLFRSLTKGRQGEMKINKRETRIVVEELETNRTRARLDFIEPRGETHQEKGE